MKIKSEIKSTVQKGREFEILCKKIIEQNFKISLNKNFEVPIGFKDILKIHKFDLGNENILVECKSCEWRANNKVPYGKMDYIIKDVFWLFLAGENYQRWLILAQHINSQKVTIAKYFVDNYSHFFFNGLEVYELSSNSNKLIKLYPI